MSENNYCVYMHTNKINGKKYVGQTCQKPETRYGTNGDNYVHCPYFYKAIQKYGWDNFTHEILFENLTFEEANQREDEAIRKYNTINSQYGYNLKGGGANPKFSDHLKKRMSEMQMGDKNGFYGKHHTEETKRKISESHKYIFLGENNPNYGKKHTADAKERMRTSRKGKHILQYDLDGNFIKEWEYMSLAVKECGLDKRSLQRACKGVLKTTGGYIWKYKNNI